MLSLHARSGPAQLFSEFVATFGLLSVIWGCSRRRSDAVPFAVGAYIAAAYWFTASTSFANPGRHARPRADGHVRRHSSRWTCPGSSSRSSRAQRPRRCCSDGSCRRSPPTADRVVVPRSEVPHHERPCSSRASTMPAGRRWRRRGSICLSDPTKARAISAGTDPGPRVHPEVVAAMNEVGVDLSGAPTTKLTPELAQRAQMLITMGCGDQCPVVPGVKRDDWPLEESQGQISRPRPGDSGRDSTARRDAPRPRGMARSTRRQRWPVTVANAMREPDSAGFVHTATMPVAVAAMADSFRPCRPAPPSEQTSSNRPVPACRARGGVKVGVRPRTAGV